MVRCPPPRIQRARHVLLPLAALLVTAASLGACGDDTAGSGGSSGTATPGGSGASGAQAGPSSGTSTSSSSPQGSGGDAAGSTSGNPSSSGDPTSSGGGDPGDAPAEVHPYDASTATIRNPERGFFTYVDLLDESDFDTALERGHSLVYSYVHLDDYREDDELPTQLLTDLEAALARLRESGLKVVLRFAYNEGPYPDSEPDAPLDRVLGHIDRLTPVLVDNADVIAVLQGGFVGAWGEWHTSTNDLTEPEARTAIVEALLDAMPANRSVLMRYPPYKQALYGDALDPADAFSGSNAARLGHHNDCFVSSASDVGTYPDDDIEGWKQYVADDTRFVPNGGETCDPDPPRSECDSTLAEMERLHYTFMNHDYHPDIVESWVDGGCKDEMDQRLGYRLVLESSTLPEGVRPGGSWVLRLRIRNDGFAAPMNPRPLWVTLTQGDQRFEAPIPDSDARRLAPGETTEIALRVRVPATLAEGDATVHLWLPDPDLGDDPRQAVRLANDFIWQEASGRNALGAIAIDDDAEGGADAATTDLELTPLD